MKLSNRVLAVAVSFVSSLTCFAQQVADPDFNTKVAKPAYIKTHPKVLFDEAHNNFHTASGRYKPFADLITNDGYVVTPNKQAFSKESLADFDVLIISNALGARLMGAPQASDPAFSDDECEVVRNWVRGGGSLLLIADHAPMGAASEKLALKFGVEMSKGYTADPMNYDVESNNQGFIKYDRENKTLADHPITRGRDSEETVSHIIAFTGQSLKGPEGSLAFMKLTDTAVDVLPPPPGSPARTERRQISAAGRAQGIALTFGKGRVVVLGEAAMLSAQIILPQHLKFGMNRPGIDNRQLALNLMHWLSRLIG